MDYHPLTHREARRKLGSRHTRRSGTNGKCIAGKMTKSGRAIKRRNPRKRSRKNAIKVWQLVLRSQQEGA